MTDNQVMWWLAFRIGMGVISGFFAGYFVCDILKSKVKDKKED